MKFKSLLCLLLFLPLYSSKTHKKKQTTTIKPKKQSLVSPKTTRSLKEKKPVSTKCNKELLNSMGFQSMEWSEEITLDMCPTVVQSCCAVQDQIDIYSYWFQGGEEKQLQDRLAYHKQVYFSLLETALAIRKRALISSYFLRKRKLSNCKVLAKRIVSFDLQSIVPKLKDAVETMHDFFENSYKGFYCSLCDATQTEYLDTRFEQFKVSKVFCRNLVEKSLNPLLYLHNHFTKFLNLSARFLASCNAKGDYKEVVVEARFKFGVKKKYYDMLTDCRKRRNDSSWFDACHKICEEFKPAAFTEFFQPNLRKFHSFTKYAQKHLVRLRQQFLLMELKLPKDFKTRILAEKKKKKTEEEELEESINELVIPFVDMNIFSSVKMSSFDLDAFKTVVKRKGFNFEAMGSQTMIEEIQFEAVREQIKKAEKEIEQEEDPKDNKKEGEAKGKGEGRKLKLDLIRVLHNKSAMKFGAMVVLWLLV